MQVVHGKALRLICRDKAQKAQRGIAHALTRMGDAVNQSRVGPP